MSGIICLWSGAIVDIPDGWVLCDGTNDTPDLTDMFIRGAGDSFAPGATGGTSSHTHWFVADAHGHELQEGDEILDSFPNGDFRDQTDQETSAGQTFGNTNIPPYYALAFIMKS